MLKKASFILLLAFLAASCRHDRQPDTDREKDAAAEPVNGITVADESLVLSDEILGEIIYSFASIVEIPALVSDLGVPFSSGFLLPASEVPQPGTEIGNAIMLGILGPGMGYMAMYGETGDMPGYIPVMSRAAAGIGAEELFDFDNIQQLASGQPDPAMLSFSFMQSYNRTGDHMRETGRIHLGTALVAGVWIEGLHLLTRAAAVLPDEEIHDRIGEQKIILNELIIILRTHRRSHREFSSLISMLEEIKKVFDKVEIVYEVDDPQAVERDGMLMVVQNQRSYVNIAQEHVDQITTRIENIRDKIIRP
ncbi:MAG: hypothetical protein EA408_03015 [Marinilabiliales bacterium]|nr:MAG: hypothetical protein EA408_03015 [Marinilabiliales bacterium]